MNEILRMTIAHNHFVWRHYSGGLGWMEAESE
jgi:hypothetical protein